jgi:hypothetical protein
VHDYRATVTGHGPVTISTKPASSRVQSVVIDGKSVKPGMPRKVSFTGGTRVVPIVVTAHDGEAMETYRVTLSR